MFSVFERGFFKSGGYEVCEMIKTKIIATLGPACANTDTIRSMIDNGVDVFRLNFSHGTTQEHQKMFEAFEEARKSHHHTTAILGDLCGPKIRTGLIFPEGERIKAGERISIVEGNKTGTARRFCSNYEKFIADVNIGNRVFIDDGQISLVAVEKRQGELICEVVSGGQLFSQKGINLPDTKISIPSITEKDWQWVDWAIEKKLDFIALSFVRGPEEIIRLREYLRSHGSDARIVAKIETPQGLEHIEKIIRASDIILVARGDLGVEMDLAEVPLIQKRLTRLCRQFGKPVVVATQMLQSMITSPTPTRAEVSDIANAIIDLTDAVMLSVEPAIGSYPVKAAETIQRIARVTEAWLDRAKAVYQRTITTQENKLIAAMASSVAQIVEQIDAKFTAVWSQDGTSAGFLSKARIDVPILALSSNQRTCRQMCLHYGVIPRCQTVPENIESFAKLADKLILASNWAKSGDKIVLVGGQSLGDAGTTSTILVHTIQQP
ncbi:MAG: pyruvate kinase [Candidatus Brocadiia bacterium]|nr:MAG: pyruvate kinase [Candidatus Brocadiia bacterium]